MIKTTNVAKRNRHREESKNDLQSENSNIKARENRGM